MFTLSACVSHGREDALLDALRRATVRLDGGAGVIVASDLVMTAGHVMSGDETRALTFSGGETAEGRVVWRSQEPDLAMLRVVVPAGYRPATSDCGTARWHDPVIVVGHPFGMLYAATSGFVAVPRTEGGDLLLDISVNPGNSGGGVFDAQGRLLGIVRAFRNMPQPFMPPELLVAGQTGLAVAVPSSAFCERIGEAA